MQNNEQVFINTYDKKGFFKESFFIYKEELENFKDYTTAHIPDGLYKPKWDGTRWIEGEDKDVILKNGMAVGLKKLGMEDLFLLILEHLEGDKKVFVQVFLNFWINRQIDAKYLDEAVKRGVITDMDAAFIKMTPQLEE